MPEQLHQGRTQETKRDIHSQCPGCWPTGHALRPLPAAFILVSVDTGRPCAKEGISGRPDCCACLVCAVEPGDRSRDLDQLCAVLIHPIEPGGRSRDIDWLFAVRAHLFFTSPMIGSVNQADMSAAGQLVLMSLGLGLGRYYNNSSSDYLSY